MFRVVLWDYVGNSAQWAKDSLKPTGIEIVRTLRPDDPDQAKVILSGDWDFVLIFEKDAHETFEQIFDTMRAMNFPTDNIIFAGDPSSWANNPAAVYSLLRPEACELFYRQCNFNNHKKWHKYIAATAEGLSYVATSADDYVIRMIYANSKNHSAYDMKLFFELTRKFYDVDDSAGYFLDLGANIGTTGIYFINKFTPNLKLLAFEPDAENFKLLRVNTILNDMEERTTLINCALGETFGEMTMYRDLKNPGHNNFLEVRDDVPTETVKVIPLDAYLAESNIAPAEVKYIWIDTEGFESQVLFGAENLLRQNPAPLFMEFNPRAWRESGNFERLVALLKSVGYSYFVWVLETIKRGQVKLYPIDALLDCRDSIRGTGSLGDIFLVRNAQ